jgi:putative aldouronate transport system substrate-binding protein
MLLYDGFVGLPTDTMALRGSALYDEIRSAMSEVVMGADISVYDRAVDRWKTNGGNQVTTEVNNWYRQSR